MDNLSITLYVDHAAGDISHTIGPYLRDYLQHRGRSRCGLGLFLSFQPGFHALRLHVGDVDGTNPPPRRRCGRTRLHRSSSHYITNIIAVHWRRRSSILSHTLHGKRSSTFTYCDHVATEKLSAQLGRPSLLSNASFWTRWV